MRLLSSGTSNVSLGSRPRSLWMAKRSDALVLAIVKLLVREGSAGASAGTSLPHEQFDYRKHQCVRALGHPEASGPRAERHVGCTATEEPHSASGSVGCVSHGLAFSTRDRRLGLVSRHSSARGTKSCRPRA